MSIKRDKDNRKFIIEITDEMVDDLRGIMGHHPAHLLGEIIFEEIMTIREKEKEERKSTIDKFTSHLRF